MSRTARRVRGCDWHPGCTPRVMTTSAIAVAPTLIRPGARDATARLTLAVQVVLGVLSTYHLVTGVVSVCFPEFSLAFYRALYHFHPQATEQYFMILKPWGALAFCAGVVGLFACHDPRRYRGVVLALAVLLTIRCGYRTLFADDMARVFLIDGARNFANTAIIACEVALLSIWLWRTRHEEVAARA